MGMIIRLVLFVFIVAALFYGAFKLGYIDITPSGKVFLDTVFNDIMVASKNFIASVFRKIADMLQGTVQP